MKRGPLIVLIILAAGLLALLLHLGRDAQAQSPPAYQQLTGVIDTRTTFSDGAYSVEGLVQLAKQKGIQVLVVNDHDRVRMEYGLPPFRNVLKKSLEHNSINLSGAERYLQAIRESEKRNPGIIIIPGTESAPFYYWSGDPFSAGLTAHNHERRLLTIGLEKAESYANLPVLHNDLSRQVDVFNGGFIFFAVALIPGIFLLIKWPGLYRWVALVAIAVSVLGLLNTSPFKGIPFNAYHGDLGIAPYQHFINQVKTEGGLAFWNYPETRSGIRKMGLISVKTPPYPEVLIESRNYTGFAALYGENITAIEPGGLWDFALIEYCNGLRDNPPWGIATGDFHQESNEVKLGDFQTVFLVREKSKQDVLSALKTGKMYAVQGRMPHVLRMDEFSITGPDQDQAALSGDDIVIKGNPNVRVSLSGDVVKNKRIIVRIIRNGHVVKNFEGDLPSRIEFEDREVKPGEKVYYRVDAKGEGRIVSNPIFIKVQS